MDKEELIQDFERYIKEVYHTDKNQEMLEQIFALLKEQEIVRCRNCRSNHQCAIQFKFADADDEENWFCADGKGR